MVEKIAPTNVLEEDDEEEEESKQYMCVCVLVAVVAEMPNERGKDRERETCAHPLFT